MNPVIVGEKIKARRKELGMSQQELADAVGYTSKVAICRIEAGQINIPMDKFTQIANVLRVPVSIFFDTFEAHVDPLDGLSEDNKKRVLEYIRFLKESEKWQKQSGMEEDGGSARH